ncbi:MAG: adenylyl-sulfate kinase [Gemmatimonadota bacterium]|nr:adenylyl-sulfate kinase [Gemmatimonadota bacterium]
MPPPLRFVLCGSVDDGKSTLLGRLLYDSSRVFSDEMKRVVEDSRRYGTQGDVADLALLVDGLQDEREQGMTIDVAYRAFETPRRRFIVADAPGHEQYTRNMVTGASTADLAVIMVDARKGILPQTARHTRIAAMFGVRHIVLAVNKMDLAGWSSHTFEAIASRHWLVTEDLGVPDVRAIPVSALTGENLTRAAANAPWYRGPTLLEHLETVETARPAAPQPLRMPVQYVNRPSPDFRGYCGRVACGAVKPGDRVLVSPAGTRAAVKSIVVWQGTRESAAQGDSVTLTLTPDVDVARGDVIVAADEPLEVADQFQARIVWMGDEPLSVGRPYRMKLHTREVGAAVTRIRHRVDVSRGAELAAPRLELNDLGVVNLATDSPVPFARYDQSRRLGGFILIDRATNATVGAGTISYPLMRAANLTWQDFDIDGDVRARLKRQRARCLWLTGLSASGKSTVANLLERRLVAEGRHTYLLDGDNVRHGLNRDLGFTEADRVENIRRVAEVARLMVDAGLIVIVSFISPFRSERDFARGLFEPGDFMEIFVDASVEACARRDPKGLYAKAMRGEIRNFTGVDSPYERPLRPDLRLDTEKLSPDECVELVMRSLPA